MFHLFLASSSACLHKPVLHGLRKCSLPSSGCDGAALGVVFKQTLCPGLGSFIPLMWQECYLSEEIISTGALFRTIALGYLEHEDAVILWSRGKRAVHRPPIEVESLGSG